ncbi:GDSL esterase/lipase 1-like [Gastrolobium bilobum]|uniref:GDSL esterase/lipase 1-like n=1 Tax=Gastrolobium bilobum TaxID=150636 RepID=UPI002AB1C1BF|nr:GDSL esterase/lipase 1-like [Gastrolobium bilobum]
MEKCHAQFKTKKEHKALFVFGDSPFDPGNNVYLSGGSKLETVHWPYGETYFKHPTGRYSDGRVVPDFIATFADLPILSPYLQPHPTRFTDGANFASGGAGVISTRSNPCIDLPTQVRYFKAVVKSLKRELGDIGAKRVLENAVYLFSIGGNDYVALHSQNPNTTESYRRAYINQVVSNLTNVFKEVYSQGARKIAYQNVGPLGCAPESRVVSTGACAQDLMAMAREHNQVFSEALKKLGSELPGLRYSIFDYYNAINDRVNNPVKYGLKEGVTACCGVGPFRGTGCGEAKKFYVCSKPYEYVWFDSAHQVERVNGQIAELIWSAPPDVTGPYNVKQLFGYQ